MWLTGYLPAHAQTTAIISGTLTDSLDQESFRAAIRHKRRVELAFENDRWFDLKRSLTSAQMATLLNAHGQAETAQPTVDRGGVLFSPSDYKYEVMKRSTLCQTDSFSLIKNTKFWLLKSDIY